MPGDDITIPCYHRSRLDESDGFKKGNEVRITTMTTPTERIVSQYHQAHHQRYLEDSFIFFNNPTPV
jgi:hypothetical protein